jgi:hypothetical protein
LAKKNVFLIASIITHGKPRCKKEYEYIHPENKPAQNMKWHSTINDPLPVDKTTVLVSVNGIYCIAQFLEGEKRFMIHQGSGQFIEVFEDGIYWTDLVTKN